MLKIQVLILLFLQNEFYISSNVRTEVLHLLGKSMLTPAQHRLNPTLATAPLNWEPSGSTLLACCSNTSHSKHTQKVTSKACPALFAGASHIQAPGNIPPNTFWLPQKNKNPQLCCGSSFFLPLASHITDENKSASGICRASDTWPRPPGTNGPGCPTLSCWEVSSAARGVRPRNCQQLPNVCSFSGKGGPRFYSLIDSLIGTHTGWESHCLFSLTGLAFSSWEPGSFKGVRLSCLSGQEN